MRKQIVVNIEEVASGSWDVPEKATNDNPHGWIDSNGWNERDVYIITDDGLIYPASLKIANASDGRRLLYSVHVDVKSGIAVDEDATQKRAAVKSAMPDEESLPQKESDVNPKIQTSLRTNESNTINRQILSEAMMDVAKTKLEKDRLTEYQGII